MKIMFKQNCPHIPPSISILIIVSLSLVLSTCGSGGEDGSGSDDSSGSSVTTTSASPTTQPYDRDLYKHWIDTDGDCQDTRQEVLIEESQIPVTFKTDKECTVKSGQWDDPYTGKVFTNPRDLDVDHVVPLKEAHISGAHLWDSEKKKLYSNDLDNAGHLMAVSLSANRSKGAKDPAEWLPPYTSYHEEYARIWIQIKRNWDLSFDEAETEILETILGSKFLDQLSN